MWWLTEIRDPFRTDIIMSDSPRPGLETPYEWRESSGNSDSLAPNLKGNLAADLSNHP